MTEPREDARLEPDRLLGFYDGLRTRMIRKVARRGRRLGPAAAEALLLVPDLFVLLVRLMLDPDVPKGARSLFGGAILYFVVPIDLFPEAVLGPVGFLEDLVLAAAVLSQALGGKLEPYARRYWSGKQELRAVLHDLTHSAQALLGGRLHGRLERALAKRGIQLPPEGVGEGRSRRTSEARGASRRSAPAPRGAPVRPARGDAEPIIEEAWREPPVDPALRGGFETPDR